MSGCGRKVEKSKVEKDANIENVEIRRYRIARIEEENGGVPPGLATGLGRIRHSLPLFVEQRWWSAAMRGGEHCACRIW